VCNAFFWNLSKIETKVKMKLTHIESQKRKRKKKKPHPSSLMQNKKLQKLQKSIWFSLCQEASSLVLGVPFILGPRLQPLTPRPDIKDHPPLRAFLYTKCPIAFLQLDNHSSKQTTYQPLAQISNHGKACTQALLLYKMPHAFLRS